MQLAAVGVLHTGSQISMPLLLCLLREAESVLRVGGNFGYGQGTASTVAYLHQ